MKTPSTFSDSMSEAQSLRVIKEMIQVSRNKLKQDGILFIVWGWALFGISIVGYMERSLYPNYTVRGIFNILEITLPVAAVSFTVYYIIKQRKKVQTYIGISLRYVWISLFASMVLINLIQNNVLQEVIFELQHPIFMVLMAFAVTITGGILRYRQLVWGGIVFGILAFVASYLKLEIQLLIESAGLLIAFIVPGHILFATREKRR